jgi:hypothetical protein
LIEVAGLADEVEIEVAAGMLTIRPSTHPIAGCAEAVAAFDPDGLLDEMTSTSLCRRRVVMVTEEVVSRGLCNRWASLSFLIRCRLDDQDAHVV